MGRRKIELGDIFELPTGKGFVYLQCVRIPEDRRQDVELIRVYYKVHPTQTTDIALIQKSSFFYLTFVLQAAYNRKIVEKVGNAPLEPDFKPPRYFRTENIFGEGWHIVDSVNWHRETVEELTDEQKKLSPWGGWNDTLLIERMDEGWTLENWEIEK
ncbi:hypothetical protein [Salinimicrobium xinjiangense]|uniref:hypothetical protein n=1 Tax=Salinimicrobium xinjiangense TaxID=438596 RepID=UPI00040C3C0F|nr:hypothetical protein [Salinimicrobium xinjiangense]